MPQASQPLSWIDTVNALIAPFQLPADLPKINSLSLDSRTLKTNDVFLAVAGNHADGRDYITAALEKSPSLILFEADGSQGQQLMQHPLIGKILFPVQGLTQQVGHIAAAFYNHPSHSLVISAVTGTNGKTTVSFLIAQALNALNVKSAVMGTCGIGSPKSLTPSPMTTLDPIRFQRYLCELKADGFTHVIIEASSHALEQGRLNGTLIRHAVFTNLTEEHLDYHLDMKTYAEAKAKLFAHEGLQTATISANSDYHRRMQAHCSPTVTQWLTTLDSTDAHSKADVKAMPIETQYGCRFQWQTPKGAIEIDNKHLQGQFNIDNLSQAGTVLLHHGFSVEETAKALGRAKGAPGRMQSFGGGHQPLVVVDYAHTPDALEKALSTLRAQTKRQLWVIFGCGGDRDTSKRPLMGAVAAKYADKVILTNDNPRDESPEAIIQAILAGVPDADQNKVIIELDRAAAIALALSRAVVQDCLLVAGKGHETKQVIGPYHYECDDRALVKEGLALIAG